MTKSTSGRITVEAILVMIVFYGCSPKHVVQSGPPSVEPRHQVITRPQNDWGPKQAAASVQYFVDDSSSISISGDSSHSPSFQTTTLFSLSLIATSDSFSLVAKIDSSSTIAHQSIGKSSVLKTISGVTHAIMSATGQLHSVTSETHLLCEDGIDPAGIRIFELTQSYPRQHIKVGDKWADTSSATSCRGKTSLHQQIIRQYELLELTNWKDHSVAKIQRDVASTIMGDGSETQNRLTATGSGKSSAILYVDRNTGLLQESLGHSESTLIITTSRGSYPFTQSIITHIELK